jgi:cytochrome oxidase Cu insertion factor (SCO1/SenC/PrrC family)
MSPLSKTHTTDMNTKSLITLAVLCLVVSLRGQDSIANAPVTPVQLNVPNVEVVTQLGEHVHFNSDLVKGRVAVVTSFFTTCTAFCPMTQERLSRLAKQLGGRMGKDVIFVSVSVDPLNDTPEVMKAWGEKFNIGPGWTLVSGNKDKVQSLLQSLGLYVNTQRHQSFLIIGNQENGWVRVSSWSSPEKLTHVIDDVKNRTTLAKGN